MTSLPPVELRTPRRSEHDEMLDGKLYRSGDPELNALLEHSADLCTRYNTLPRGASAERQAILDELIPHHGEHLGTGLLRLRLPYHHRRSRIHELQLHLSGLRAGEHRR